MEKIKVALKNKVQNNKFKELKNENILNNGYGVIDSRIFDRAQSIINNIHFKNNILIVTTIIIVIIIVILSIIIIIIINTTILRMKLIFFIGLL